MEDSVFTKIIKGDLPCHKVYEDARTFAFLDIHPIQPGQVVVVPKKQVDYVWNLDDEDYQALMATGKKVAWKLKEAFPDKHYVALHVEGLELAHAHLKIFPFNTDTEFHNHPDTGAEPDHDALAQIAAKLRLPDKN
ncbi:MAG TPA: HIT family protein [Candidatus Saccharimonadales bacterium]|nr:HIT family protein [Candidatus Saccharimonadales bacterium]